MKKVFCYSHKQKLKKDEEIYLIIQIYSKLRPFKSNYNLIKTYIVVLYGERMETARKNKIIEGKWEMLETRSHLY